MDILTTELLDLNSQVNTAPEPQIKTLLTQLTEAVNSGEDTTCLIGPVMKLLPNHNVQIKKSIHGALPRLCKKHPQAAVLAANSILQDCADLNPVIKCLGVTSLACIPELSEHAPSVLLGLLNDGHPRVRLAAVQACRAFHSHSSLAEHGLIDALYAAVRDSDPQVATTSLLSLDAVLAEEGGIIVTRAMARHLLRRLSNFAAPQLASVLQALAKYKPKDENELFEELSLLDPYLVYTNCAAVAVNCICLFLTLLGDNLNNLIGPLVERSTPTLTQYLTASESGALCVLQFLNSDAAMPWLNSIQVSKLVPLESDSTTVKSKKLKLIPKACCIGRAEEILRAVTPWCEDRQCSKEAIECVCSIRSNCPDVAAPCLDILMQVISSNTETTLTAMEGFSLETIPQTQVASLLHKIVDTLDILQPESFPPVLPYLLGSYGELLPNASYLLEHMVNNIYQLQANTRRHLLTAMLRMFLKEPAECQLALGRLLCECLSSSDSELSARATKYYTILTNNPQLLKDILLPFNIIPREQEV